MSYLPSSQISIFPTSIDRSSDNYFYNGRVLSENNIATLISAVVDNDSFVISYDSSTREIKFMLAGHLVIATLSKDLINNSPLYAHAKVERVVTDKGVILHAFTKIAGVDSTTDRTFEGISFTNNSIESGYEYNLQLLDAQGNVPTEKYYKLESSSIRNINGGTV